MLEGATNPKLPAALRMYRIASFITGVLLILLLAEMILKYGFGLEVFGGSSRGIIALFPLDDDGTRTISTGDGINLSTLTLILHGWFYLFYLASDFYLWTTSRCRFWVFVLIALGGVVPFMSFVVEHYVYKNIAKAMRQAKAIDQAEELDQAEATDQTKEKNA